MFEYILIKFSTKQDIVIFALYGIRRQVYLCFTNTSCVTEELTLLIWLQGKKGSKSQLAGPALPGLMDLQNALELERKRNVKLTEQMDKLRQENYAQAQECECIAVNCCIFLIIDTLDQLLQELLPFAKI